jgi:hypothetical protein
MNSPKAGLVLIFAASRANINEQLGNSIDGSISDARSGAHRITFNQQV